MFVKDLVCLWIRVRQAGGADPDETPATLFGWVVMELEAAVRGSAVEFRTLAYQLRRRVTHDLPPSCEVAQLAQDCVGNPAQWRNLIGCSQSNGLFRHPEHDAASFVLHYGSGAGLFHFQ